MSTRRSFFALQEIAASRPCMRKLKFLQTLAEVRAGSGRFFRASLRFAQIWTNLVEMKSDSDRFI